MTYGYTLYLYPGDKASHWCEILDTMEWLARKYSVSDCRQSNPKLHKVFLKLQRSGIRFDTVECDRTAIFVEDTVEVGSREKSGGGVGRRVKAWGFGGKTGKQVKRKLISMLKAFGALVKADEIMPDLNEFQNITGTDIDEIIAHIRFEELKDEGAFCWGV